MTAYVWEDGLTRGSPCPGWAFGEYPHVWHLIEKLGGCRWPALLLGETGTGKEVVAREIHARNPQGPFITIDCSSLVGPLMESELFGHVRGAFTGAAGPKLGLIEAANGGTAFFDEIGELPLDLQSKLLRVLQEKEFRPVGSLTLKRSDFRIIAATNRDLAQEVEKGTFRRDLYFRLSVMKIRLAPLRERKEDVPALVEHFLRRAGGNRTLTAEAMEALLSYDWPGNVRELENCIQHMVAISSGTLVHTEDLPSPVQNHLAQKKSQYLTAAVGLPVPPVTQACLRVSLPPEPPNASSVIPLAELERRHPACSRIHQRRPRLSRDATGDRPDNALSKAQGIRFRRVICGGKLVTPKGKGLSSAGILHLAYFFRGAV